jgi:hypothetical protein
MKLTPTQTKLIDRARRSKKAQRTVAWTLVLSWPAWTYLAAAGAVPRLELPLATVLMLFAVPVLIRPVVDARVLDVLINIVSDGKESIERRNVQ